MKIILENVSRQKKIILSNQKIEFTAASELADIDLTKNTAFFAPASLHNYEVHKRKTAIIMTFMEATLEASVKAVLEVIVEAPPLCTAAEGGDCCCRLLFVFPAVQKQAISSMWEKIFFDSPTESGKF